MSVQTLPSRFTHGKFRPSVTIKTFPKLVKKKPKEIYEAGKLPQRSDSPASQEPRTPDMNGMESTMQEKNLKQKTSSGILFIHSRFREPLVVNTVA